MTQTLTPSPWQSIVAGGAAGGLESLLTYPTEYLKTRQQLQSPGTSVSPLKLLIQTLRQHGASQMYTGAAAFCVSNAAKSGVRFFAFDSARQFMPTDPSGSGKTTTWGNVGAGLIAGIAESVFVVTPGETLKTKIIDDQTGAKRYTSATHAVRSVLTTEGLSGLYRGVVPVMLKQSANAMVRFTSYNFFLEHLRDLPGLGSESVIGASVPAGALAGVVTVYATMPFDTMKTRLQALDARQRYSGTLDCLRSIVSNEGVAVLWRGTTPRLARLSTSGAISFTIYESVIRWTQSVQASQS